MNRSARAAAVAFFLVVLVAVPAAAQTSPADPATTQTGEPAKPAPKLAFAGHTKPTLRLVDGDSQATATVVLSNTGTLDATGVTFLLLDDDSAAIEACGVKDITVTGVAPTSPSCTTKPAPITVVAGTSKRLVLVFRVEKPAQTRDPMIQAQSSPPPAGTAPLIAEATMSRSLSDGRLWWPLWAAAAAGAAVLLLGWVATKGANNRDVGKSPWTSKVYTAAAWSFGDSWATNIAALGGVLGTVLAATGFFGEVLPGVSSGRFTGFSLVFAGLALMAPIVYTVLGSPDDVKGERTTVGTVAGLVLASAVTVAAVGGELATLWLLVGMSDASSAFQLFCTVGLIVAAMVVIAYAVRSAAWLSDAPKPKDDPAGGSPSRWIQSSSGVP